MAAIHSELLKRTVVKDFAEMFPERFNNKTNGVTPRRWLLPVQSAAVARDHRGDRRRLDHRPGQLGDLKPLADDPAFRGAFRKAKREAKARFADWLKATSGQVVDPDTIFDSQIKRIHEYKRQLLNALHIVVLYNRLRENPDSRFSRRARSSSRARPRRPTSWPRLIIKFINNLAGTIDGDPALQGKLKVLFLPDYCVLPGGAADPGQRRVGADLDRRLRSQRHEQHEVHDERRADDRHARRRDDRDGRRRRAKRTSSCSG